MRSTDEIVSKAEALLGGGQVLTMDDVHAPRIDRLAGPWVPDTARPQAVVQPATIEELQALVRLAGETGYSLWCTPNGAGNGVTVGNLERPSLLLDLTRMDRIVEFDTDSACALLEPGVSFNRLLAYIDDQGLPFWIDCDLNGAHSICGSVCERAYGFTPYGDHLLMQCGMEIVLANGTVTRTGMGAVPGNNTWQLFKYNFGPYLDGLFSRSDFAVVSKLGLWLMPAPPAYHPFMVTLPTEAAVGAAVELLRPFKIEMTIPNTVAISHLDTERALLEKLTDTTASDVDELVQSGALGTWNLYGALYGLPDNVAFVWDRLGDALGSLPGAKVFSAKDGRDDAAWTTRTKLMRGVPAYSDAAPADDPMWFVASAAMEEFDAKTMFSIVADELGKTDISFLAEFALSWRTLFLRIEVPYGVADRTAKRDLVLVTMKRLAEAGYAVTHDSPDLTRAVAENQNGTGLAHLYDLIGQALDPAGTLGTRAR